MRLRWLDLLRSAAIVGMIVYHAAFDLQSYRGWNMDVTTGWWKVFQACIASVFLVVSGISAGLWTQRPNAFAKAWKRATWILSAALLVSLATAIVDDRTWVRFGILHLVALSAFLLPFLRRLHPLGIAALGAACIAPAPFVPAPPFATVDWVPPIPWLGPVLLGFAVGIPLSKRTPKQATPSRMLDALAWPGKHSLTIYLLHQPVLMAVLAVLPHP